MSERNHARLFRALVVYSIAMWIVMTWIIGRAV